jgi:DNA-binding MarR family transcriptional regulator
MVVMTRKSKSTKTQPGRKQNPAFLLSQVGAHSAEVYATLLVPLKLTPAYSGILWMLGRSGGLSQRQLAGAIKIHPSRLVAILDELEDRGLVERQAHANDRRLYALHLTKKGESIFEKLRGIASEHRKLICSALSEEECDQLADFLQRIAEQQGLIPGVHPGYRWLGRKIKPGRGKGETL